MQQWLVYRDDATVGPIASSDLKRLAATGELSPTDVVGLAGSSERFVASKVNGLFPHAAVPPPIPPRNNRAEGVDAKRVVESFRSFATDAKDYAKEQIDNAASAARAASEEASQVAVDDRDAPTLSRVLTEVLRLSLKQKAILAALWLTTGLAFSSCIPLPGILLPTVPARSAGSIPMTVDELRKELLQEYVFSPKAKFYNKYGKPKRTIDPGNGNDVYLLYDCTDNPVRIECASGNFQTDSIYVLSVREN